MLVKDFYFVLSKEEISQGEYLYLVELNPSHEVYKGHFPEKPITPGVCNILMIKELSEDALQKTFTLDKIDRCRLTNMVTPEGSPKLNVRIKTENASEQGKTNLSAEIFFSDVTFMTLSGVLTENFNTLG